MFTFFAFYINIIVDSGRLWQKVGDNMLMGEFHHNLDEKQRLVIPNKYRDELGNEFVITRGIEHCLYVYPMNKWNALVEKLNTLSFTKKDARTFTRSFFAGASICTFDKQGRIVLSDVHRNYANIKKECVIIGVNDRLEIWSENDYNSFMDDNALELENISEHLFED